MTEQTDADLIREIEIEAEALSNYQSTDLESEGTIDILRRAAARIEELTQPAPQPDPVVWECKAGGLKPLTQRLYEAQPDNIKRHYTRIEQPAPQRVVDKSELKRLVCQVFGEDFQIVRTEQPAPLALNEWDARAWHDLVANAKDGSTLRAVDALLRRRVQRLTDEQIDKILEQQRMRWVTSPPTYEFAQAFARAIEAKLIGEGS